MRKKTSEVAKARIRWRRGTWCSVEEFLRGEHKKRAVGPGMEQGYPVGYVAHDALYNHDGHGQVPMHLRLDQLDGK